jgi:hypothetical protein
MNNPNNPESNKGSQAKHFAEPDSQRLVQKHMNDEQHEITDEEIRNVRISTDHINLNETQVLKHEREKEEAEDGDTEQPIVTPWDVTT